MRRIAPVIALCLATLVSPAKAAPVLPALPTAPFDARALLSGAIASPAQRQAAARTPGVRVTWDERFGTPSTVLRYGAALTAPARDPESAARAWIRGNAAMFGWPEQAADSLRLIKNVAQPGGAPRSLLFHQTFGGLDAGSFGGAIDVGMDARNRIVIVRASAVRTPALAAGRRIGVDAALTIASGGAALRPAGTVAGWMQFRNRISTPTYARLVAFPMPDAPARPAWEIFWGERNDSVWRTTVDALDGSVLYRRQTVLHWAPEGRVFLDYPGAANGGSDDMQSFRGDAEASPAGWQSPAADDDRLPTTAGNNAVTATHWIATEAPDGPGEVRPASSDGTFDIAYADAWHKSRCGAVDAPDPAGRQDVQPTYVTDAQAAVLNLFYHHNVMHDFWYHMGFTPEAGALQANNFGRAGIGGDALIGLSQAGAAGPLGRNNAYMQPLPDGIPSWSGMFLFESGTDAPPPCVDGDFDAGVIYHEYTHAVTSRWVGNEYGNLDTQQGGSMGEAWSDFFAMHYLTDAGLEHQTVMGPYVTGDPVKGIRNFTLGDNPLTYGDFGYDGGPEVHSDGEIWSGTLWELRTKLASVYSGGAGLAAQLVADAMPLSGPSPTMLDVRDAILAADQARTAGANQALIWQVFAHRGMGASAKSASGDDVHPIPAFDVRPPSGNGRVTVRVTDAVSGAAVSGAELFLGTILRVESAVATTNGKGEASLLLGPGPHEATIRMKGYGTQQVVLQAKPASTVVNALRIAPNYASKWLGASASAGDDVTDPSAAIDDGSASWATAKKSDANAITIKLAGNVPVRIGEVRLSVEGPPSGEALDSWTMLSSIDGKTFTPLTSGRLGHGPHWLVSVGDLASHAFRPRSVVSARYVRLIPTAAMSDSSASIAISEVQVFGAGQPFKISGVRADPFADSGTVTVPSPNADPATPQPLTVQVMAHACSASPPTKGVDAWVSELPSTFAQGDAAIRVVSVPVDQDPLPDVDVYFLDDKCAVISQIASSAHDERGPIPKGTRYVVSELWSGLPAKVDVTATRDTITVAAIAPAKSKR